MNKTVHPRAFKIFRDFRKNIYCLHLPALLTCLLFCTQIISAQSIGNWTFNSTLTGTPGTYNAVSVADFSSSVPIRSFNGGSEYYGENGWPSGTINTAMYMQFSLTPLSGYQIDISSLVLVMRRSNTGSPAGSGPTAWSLRSSLDGFASDIASGSMTLNYATYTVTPGSAFINLYTTVTFRLYGYNASIGSGGNSRFVFDNIRVNGIGYLLPVRLGNITAAATAEKVNLSYTVYNTEQNNQYFIERSADGSNFSTVYSIDEMSSETEKKYMYTDVISAFNGIEKIYYRVRLRNNISADTYSPVITLTINSNRSPLKIMIRNNQLNISGYLPATGVYQANIFSISGQMLQRITFSAISGYNTFVFNLGKPMPAGCVVQVAGKNGYSCSIYAP